MRLRPAWSMDTYCEFTRIYRPPFAPSGFGPSASTTIAYILCSRESASHMDKFIDRPPNWPAYSTPHMARERVCVMPSTKLDYAHQMTGDRIGICSHNCSEYLVNFWACRTQLPPPQSCPTPLNSLQTFSAPSPFSSMREHRNFRPR